VTADEVKAGIRDLSARVDQGLTYKSVWPGLHAVCGPYDGGYALRLGEVFGAVMLAADVRYRQYLPGVLKAKYKDGTLADCLRSAAGIVYSP
jgi:hypothetical protein